MTDKPDLHVGPSRHRPLNDEALRAAVYLHAKRRGIDLAEWPNQQALLPDEARWMRDALNAYFDILEASGA